MWLFKHKQLTFHKVDFLCQSLSGAVAGYKPQCIVSIDTGGRYVGEKLSKILDVPHLNIYICRNIYDVPFIKKMPLIFRLIVRWVLFRFTKPVLQKGLTINAQAFIQNKRVLLVDDAISSGRTMDVGIEALQGATVKTAVLVNIARGEVDFSLLKGAHYFPWSRISPEYKKFKNYLEQGRT